MISAVFTQTVRTTDFFIFDLQGNSPDAANKTRHRAFFGSKGRGIISRRQCVTGLGLLPVLGYLPKTSPARDIPDFTQLKSLYAKRLKKILASGELPCVDIESSCHSAKIKVKSLAESMDWLNIGLMALSADIGSNQSRRGVRIDNLSRKLVASYPDCFIPVGNGGLPPVWTEFPDEFLDAQEAAIQKKQMMLLGEYEFRHYPSPGQAWDSRFITKSRTASLHPPLCQCK